MNPLLASKILADEYNLKILTACHQRPLSAQWLAIEYDIPIAACYRKISLLEKVGLLEKDTRILTRQGKRMWLYQSKVKSAQLSMEGGRLRVKFEMLDTPQEDQLWNSMEILTA